MRTKTVPLALLLAAAALSARAGTVAEAAAERAERTPVPATIGSLDQRAAPDTRAEQKAPTVGVGSPFSVFTYDVLGATPRVQLGKRHAAPDATQAKSVAAR